MQFGISPPETHKPRLKMSSSRSREDIRRRVRTHDPLLLLPTSPAANGSSSLWMYPAPQVFRYTGRQSFGEVYTLCFKGGDKWRCPGAVAPRWERIVLHARWPAHGRPHSYRFHPTDNRSRLTGSRCSPRVWAELYPIPTTSKYDVSSDGQKFLMNTIIDEAPSPITVILNWLEELKQRVPVK